MNSVQESRPKSISTLMQMKHKKKLVMLTAYDYTMSCLLDDHADIILVGDTLGCVVQGHATTLSVTLDQMIYHAAMVKRGAQCSFVIADLPFGSYQKSPEDALDAAVRLMKESGVSGVKLEGGTEICGAISKIVQAGIPVMAHLGLTPQSYHAMGGNKVQGKTPVAAEQLMQDAKAVEAAGAFALVLEAIPPNVAAEVTGTLTIPTIGIGAGPQCDGQVLVINDLVGLNQCTPPMKFNKEYCAVRDDIRRAVEQFATEVRNEEFPDDRYCYYTNGS